MAAVLAGVRSAVSRATIAPPMESPTNRTPSGPKVSAPADFRSALPGVSAAAALTDSRAGHEMAATAIKRASASPARTTIRYCIVPPQKRTEQTAIEAPILRPKWVLGACPFLGRMSRSGFLVLGSAFWFLVRGSVSLSERWAQGLEPRTQNQNPEPEPRTQNPEPRTQNPERDRFVLIERKNDASSEAPGVEVSEIIKHVPPVDLPANPDVAAAARSKVHAAPALDRKIA